MTHDEAVGWAQTVRTARYSLREQLGTAEFDLCELLEVGQRNSLVGQVKLLWALESFPGARKVDTRRQLAKMGISDSVRINELQQTSIESLVSNFAPPSQTAATR